MMWLKKGEVGVADGGFGAGNTSGLRLGAGGGQGPSLVLFPSSIFFG